MSYLNRHRFLPLLSIVFFTLIIVVISCQQQTAKDFGIYLLAEDRTAIQLAEDEKRYPNNRGVEQGW